MKSSDYPLKVKIRATSTKNKKDIKAAKLLERIIQSQLDKYNGIVSAIIYARTYNEDLFSIRTPDRIWDNIMNEVIRMEMSNIIKQTKKSKRAPKISK